MLYTKNREKQWVHDIDSSAWKDREPGLSAFVRLANEEEWIEPSIRSILPWCDEVVCALQCSTDRTEEILRSIGDPKISIFQYPFKPWPNGPGHGRQPGDSLHNNAYFYNWNLSMTRHEWAIKWDGDMVAMDGLGDTIRGLIDNAGDAVVCMSGINLVGDCMHMSKEQPTIHENQPRLFRMRPGVYYLTGAQTQMLTYPAGARRVEIEGAAYLHFKWAKRSCYQGWPDNWREIPHFQRIAERAIPGKKYTGETPVSLKGILDAVA